MSKITKRETLSLLRKVQRFQFEDGGVHSISISVYKNADKRGSMWFTYSGNVDGEFHSGACYEWRDYELNHDEFLRFASFFE